MISKQFATAMKKIFILNKIFISSLIAGVTLSFCGCAGEEDDLFDSSAAERLAESKATYTERFAADGGTWAMEYFPTSYTYEPQGCGYLLLLAFSDDGSVRVGMKNDFSDDEYKEDTSLWEVIADTGPVLTFNTYNECLHAFSDPSDISFTSDDETGLGCEGDYEFIVLSLEEDATEATIKGKKRGIYERLRKLPEETDFEEYIEDVQDFQDYVFSSSAPNYALMTVGDSVKRIDDGYCTIPNIYRFGGDAVVNESYHPYIISKQDDVYSLRFRDEFEIGDAVVQEFEYDEDEKVFHEVDNYDYTITGPNPNVFMTSDRWNFTRTSEMADEVYDLVYAMYTGFKSLSYTMSNLRLIFDEDNDSTATFTITYRKTANVTIQFLYDLEKGEDSFTLKYNSPVTTSSTNPQSVVDAIPAIQDFLDALEGTFVATEYENPFDMSYMTLTWADNEDRWIVVTNY